ncbi:MAG TPA: c-type cytochrome [Steroidobacteraceae bacterium]|nr:c-type cytochrome [Steroidobacteraceae bacterium]
MDAGFRRGWMRYVTALMVIAAVGALAWLVWVVLGPGPMDFAGGRRIVLAGTLGSGSGAASPTGVPGELVSASLVERGRYLARAADCASCHTKPDGQPFAGGRAFVLPFGTIYSTNITPDAETGIGAYTDADFLRAVHQGIARDGTRLYPAMPFASYTYLTDADALAIKAYLFSLPPVQSARTTDSLRFPFNQRWLMSIWSALFNPDRRFQANGSRSAEWNRGAYLAEALGHCGECHTPRNIFQALDNRRKFSGARQAGWRSFNLTPDPQGGVGAWSREELTRFIAGGHASGHGSAGGPMGEAVDMSLQHLTPADIQALVTYISSVPAVATPDLPAPRTTPAPASHAQGLSVAVDPRGKEIFEGACVGCHGWTGADPAAGFAALTGSRAVNDPTATNIVQMVLDGSSSHGEPNFMPAFGHAYTDLEIAAVANYVTARFGSQPSRITADRVAELRGQSAR